MRPISRSGKWGTPDFFFTERELLNTFFNPLFPFDGYNGVGLFFMGHHCFDLKRYLLHGIAFSHCYANERTYSLGSLLLHQALFFITCSSLKESLSKAVRIVGRPNWCTMTKTHIEYIVLSMP